MEKLYDLIRKNHFLTMMLPTGIGFIGFVGNLLLALSDGNIDTAEYHQLMSSANGIETIILVLVMAAMRNRTDNKQK